MVLFIFLYFVMTVLKIFLFKKNIMFLTHSEATPNSSPSGRLPPFVPQKYTLQNRQHRIVNALKQPVNLSSLQNCIARARTCVHFRLDNR